MVMHLLPVARTLSSEYRALYDRRGAFLPGLASLVGWACGLALDAARPAMAILVAVVAGGVVVNAASAELPREKEGRHWPLLAGPVAYAGLPLTLSHSKEGG